MSERLEAVRRTGRGSKPECSRSGSRQDEEIEFKRDRVNIGFDLQFGSGRNKIKIGGIGITVNREGGFTGFNMGVGPFEIKTFQRGCDIITEKSILGQVVQYEYQLVDSPECRNEKERDSQRRDDGRSRYNEEDINLWDEDVSDCFGYFICAVVYHYGYIRHAGKVNKTYYDWNNRPGISTEITEKILGADHGHFLEYIYPVFDASNPYKIVKIQYKINPADTFCSNLVGGQHRPGGSGFSNRPGSYRRHEKPEEPFEMKYTSSSYWNYRNGMNVLVFGFSSNFGQGLTLNAVRNIIFKLKNKRWLRNYVPPSDTYDFYFWPQNRAGLCRNDRLPIANNPPRKKPRNDMSNCCPDIKRRLRKIEKLLEEIHQALATKELLKNGLEIPNHWLVPKGKGHSKALNYLEIFNYQMRMIDHLSIHPLKIDIPDINPAKKGKQRLHEYYPNATAWAKKMLELSLENKGDSATRLNLTIRIAIIVTRLYSTVIAIEQRITGIFQYLGAPLKNQVNNIKFPFDITLGGREKIRTSGPRRITQQVIEEKMKEHLEELDKLEEKNTEASLPYFLKDTDQPVSYETYDREQPNLIQRILGYGKESS